MRRIRSRWSPVPLAAIVEVFTASEVVGWVQVDKGSPPVRVGLYLNDLEAAGTWAVDRVDRHGAGELRSFRLALRDIWKFCGVRDRLTVRVAGNPVPIANHGLYLGPAKNGGGSAAQLRDKLSSGHLFGQFGALQLSKAHDTQWQHTVMDLYRRVGAVLEAELGYDAFFCYGTLLGAVREKNFIGHDGDFDAAYISRHSYGPDAAREAQRIAYLLLDAGFDVDCMRTAVHIHDADSKEARIDLFHLYFDDQGHLSFPFGVAGTSDITKDEWRGTKQIPFGGSTGRIPVIAEQLTEHIYGANWRVPKPGFRWVLDRTKQTGRPGVMPVDFGIEFHWDKYYRSAPPADPSPFCAALLARADLPGTVVDLGCGAGRDALAFAAAGRRVLGLDRSKVGIEKAQEQASERRVGPVEFRRCDFADADALRELLRAETSTSGDAPVLFYARFLLHAIEEDTQQSLLSALRDCARPGDLLAVEARIAEDEKLPKAHGKHYRRFQPAGELAGELERAGFTVVEQQEGTGLSAYADEDPVLYRATARFTGAPTSGFDGAEPG
jgi:SAM-dependent methyltransferase